MDPDSVVTGRSSEAGWKHPSVASASCTSDSGSSRCSAISLGRGERPSVADSSSLAAYTAAWSSWMRRVGRITQPWSRK